MCWSSMRKLGALGANRTCCRAKLSRPPSPRRFLKTQVRLSSDDPQNAVLLRRLEVSFSQPWVGRALGEVFPVQVEHPGEDTRLTFFVRPVRRCGRSRALTRCYWSVQGRRRWRCGRYGLGSAAEVAAGGGQALGLDVVEVPRDRDRFAVGTPAQRSWP